MTCSPFLDGCLARTPPAGACLSAVEAAELVVSSSVDVLEPFFCPGSRCPTVRGLVTHGPPDVSTYSMVAAWVESVDHSVGDLRFPRAATATVGVQLWVDTFPLGEWEGESYYPPDPDLLHEASLVDDHRAVVVPGDDRPDRHERRGVRFVAARCDETLGPDGTFVGWETGFSLEL